MFPVLEKNPIFSFNIIFIDYLWKFSLFLKYKINFFKFY